MTVNREQIFFLLFGAGLLTVFMGTISSTLVRNWMAVRLIQQLPPADWPVSLTIINIPEAPIKPQPDESWNGEIWSLGETVGDLRFQGIAAMVAGRRYVEARRFLSEVLEQVPEDDVARFWLAMAQFALGQEDQAVQNWQQAGAGYLLYQIGRGLADQGRME